MSFLSSMLPTVVGAGVGVMTGMPWAGAAAAGAGKRPDAEGTDGALGVEHVHRRSLAGSVVDGEGVVNQRLERRRDAAALVLGLLHQHVGHVELGIDALLHQGRHIRQARAAFERALQIDPSYAQARVDLARLLAAMGGR